MKTNISKDKEEKIYEAALEEFASNGYENGSTNAIVKKAGISKGALFKYFGNKANLFIYVTDKAIDKLDEKILGGLDGLSSDMFERIVQLTEIKVTMSMKYQLESSILVQSMAVEDEEVKKYITKKINYYYEMLGKIFTEGIDYSKFKDGVDVGKVYEILTYISEGLEKKYMAKYHGKFEEMAVDVDEMSKEVFSYIDLIRDSVYK